MRERRREITLTLKSGAGISTIEALKARFNENCEEILGFLHSGELKKFFYGLGEDALADTVHGLQEQTDAVAALKQLAGLLGMADTNGCTNAVGGATLRSSEDIAKALTDRRPKVDLPPGDFALSVGVDITSNKEITGVEARSGIKLSHGMTISAGDVVMRSLCFSHAYGERIIRCKAGSAVFHNVVFDGVAVEVLEGGKVRFAQCKFENIRETAIVAKAGADFEIGKDVTFEKVGRQLFSESEEAARREAEETARRQAEEEGRRREVDEARRKAEEEARREAEETARIREREDKLRQAEEEARKRTLELTGEMVFVSGGTFMMGDLFGDGVDDEKPVHEVSVNYFYIGKYPVTQRQWTAIMGSNPSHWKGVDLPVESVSWDEVQEFITKLNQQTGQNLRLPTEAEWEYAARSGGKKEKWAGTSDEAQLATYAWYDTNSGGVTHPVGEKLPNGLGLHDMSGNVWEWCEDRYDKNYYASSPKGNPKGPQNDGFFSRANRVLRGGSWHDLARNCRVSSRFNRDPGLRGSFIGVRLALSVQ